MARFPIAYLSSDAIDSHQLVNAVNPASLTIILKIPMNFSVTVHAARFQPCLFDQPRKLVIFTLTSRLRLTHPCVITARVKIEQPAERSNREVPHVLFNKGVSHSGWLAKYAAAFFKRSRSSVTRLSSFFNRRISSDSCDAF